MDNNHNIVPHEPTILDRDVALPDKVAYLASIEYVVDRCNRMKKKLQSAPFAQACYLSYTLAMYLQNDPVNGLQHLKSEEAKVAALVAMLKKNEETT